MKREFLQELGIEEEQIDRIMAEYGKSINPLKEDRDSLSSQLESMQEQIRQRDEQLNDLAKKAEGHDELKSQIDSLKKANEDAREEYQKEIRQKTLDLKLENELIKAKARNPVAVKALLDMEAITLGEDGNLIGLSEQLEKKKESDWYLFEQEEADQGAGEEQTPPPPTHIAGNRKKTNKPSESDPYEKGRQKAMERFKKEEA